MNGRALHKKVISIFVSILLSFFLWLTLSGQDTSITELIIPLELIDLPSDLIVRTEIPKTITFRVQANTAQLRFLDDLKLKIALNASSAREGFNALTIDQDMLDLPRGVQVTKVTPSVLEFDAIKIISKVIPLKPETTGVVHKDYRLKSIVIEPDQVTIQGPQEILASIESLYTTPIPLDDLTKDTTITVTPLLSEQPSGLVVTPREIKATVSIEEIRLEETFKKIPIDPIIKGQKAHGLKLVPETAEISISWPASRPRAVTASEIRIQVTVSETALAQNPDGLTLPLVVVAPPGVSVTSITPSNVHIKNINTAQEQTP